MKDIKELTRLLYNYSLLLDALRESNTAGEFSPGYKGESAVEDYLSWIYCPAEEMSQKALKEKSLNECISQSIEYDRQAAVKLMNELKIRGLS